MLDDTTTFTYTLTEWIGLPIDAWVNLVDVVILVALLLHIFYVDVQDFANLFRVLCTLVHADLSCIQLEESTIDRIDAVSKLNRRGSPCKITLVY